MGSFFTAFALTLFVETGVLVGLHRQDHTLARIGLVALVANILTHPLVFLLFPHWFATWSSYLVVAEAFALLAEVPVLWLGLRPLPISKALSSSALANGASYLVGLAWITLR